MRTFKIDGKEWVAKIHDPATNPTRPADVQAGWEIVQFDTQPPGNIKKITYRPPGWLNNASIQELIQAMLEGESVRAGW